jgi:cytochrome P450
MQQGGSATMATAPRREGERSQALPPGPPVGRVTQAVAFHRDPLGFLLRARARYGDVFTMRMALVKAPMVVFSDPRAIGQIAPADPSTAHTGEARMDILGIVPPPGILVVDAEQHRAIRGRIAPAFTRETLEGQRDAMMSIAEHHLEEWPRGRPFQMLLRMRKLTLDIFVRLVLGVRDDARATALVAATRRMLRTGVNPPLPPPGAGDGLLGVLGKALLKWRRQPVDRVLRAEIEARRAGGQDGSDVISCLLRSDPPMSMDDMLDELVTLLMPAHESGPAGLTWVLDRLARDPDFADHFALAGAGDARSDAFIRETLRLRPSVHSVVRRLIAPMEILGHHLPPGVIATIPTLLVHRDPQAFPDPEAFRPERFLADGAAAEAPLIPFGGGVRRCLGEPLALAEIHSVLPTILRRLRLQALSPQPERMVVRGTVASPHRGALAVAHDR